MPAAPCRGHCCETSEAAREDGEVDAATEAEAVEKAAVEFKQYAPKLMAVPRS
jgi:hypothetical protein